MSELKNETSVGMPIGDIPIDVLDTDVDPESGISVATGISEFELELGGGEVVLDVLHSGGAEVEEDGTVIADEVTVITDESTGAMIIDEMVTIIQPDGTEIHDHTLSTIDADGTFTFLGEEVSVVEHAPA